MERAVASPPERPFLDVHRSLTGRTWRSRLSDDRLGLALAQHLAMPEIVGRILAARGVSPEESQSYLSPNLKDMLPDPSRFRDMDAACHRLAEAIVEREPVGVFGDYDVDGATSSALLLRFLRAVGGRCQPYIPDRLAEGYGPNWPAFQHLMDEGVQLIVTVDCGISAFDVLDKAAGHGLDVVVVDHHLAESRLPRARAVVNPNRLDEDRAFSQLAAVGVTFLLVVGTNRLLRQQGWYRSRPEPDLRQWLDLVALGTVCDVVPLSGVNRAFVTQGLKVIARRGNAGLAALADITGLDQPPGVYHLGFVLGPRVNAGGRVGRADLGVRLLSSDDGTEAQAMARELEGYNAERKALEAQVLEEALAQFEKTDPNVSAVVIEGRDWHPGVIGIVASRIKEAGRRPTFVIAVNAGVGKGSGRSIPGIDLGAAVTAARQAGLLINGGGHAMAAGITIAENDIPAFTEFLCQRLEGMEPAWKAAATLSIDGALALGGANSELLGLVERAGPFGAGNPEPRFVFPNVRVVSSGVVGKDHVRCILADRAGARLKGIAFRAAETDLGRALLHRDGQAFHVAGHLRADHWRGERRIQLNIDDAAPVDTGERG